MFWGDRYGQLRDPFGVNWSIATPIKKSSTMNSRTALWTGRVLSGIAVLFLIFDGAIKLVPIQPVTDSLRELGYPATDSFARFLGIVTLVCTALYAWPRTAAAGRRAADRPDGWRHRQPSPAGRSVVQPYAVRRLARPVLLGLGCGCATSGCGG